MNPAAKVISTIFLILLVQIGNSFAQEDLLSQVPELQERARKSNSGELGCGPSDFSVVFSGKKVGVQDLLVLLKARVEANRTGEQNPMSGEVKDLVYAILSGLPYFKDASVIPVVRELLYDKNEVISRWSAIALIRLAEQNEELKKEIEQITFPRRLAQRAFGQSKKLPEWVKVEEDK